MPLFDKELFLVKEQGKILRLLKVLNSNNKKKFLEDYNEWIYFHLQAEKNKKIVDDSFKKKFEEIIKNKNNSRNELIKEINNISFKEKLLESSIFEDELDLDILNSK